jgi:hypothetical protein
MADGVDETNLKKLSTPGAVVPQAKQAKIFT